MKRKILFVLFFMMIFTMIRAQAPDIDPAAWPTIKGLWKFDNPGNLVQASYGSNLVLTGTQSSVPGPQSGNLAVNIGIGSYYKCFHNIAANGGGTQVNQYSLVIDFKVDSLGIWYCFYQTNASNSNDGELFISPNGKVGRATNGPGYSDYQVIPGDWYRLVVTCDLGNEYKIYLDGILVRDGGNLAVDADYALYPSGGNNYFYFFADNDGEDGPINSALCAVFQGVLSPQQVTALGGYGHNITPVLSGILPYLQTPSPTSVYISWHSNDTSSTSVNYGQSGSLGIITTGSQENIGTKHWHTVKLQGLLPNTEYYYRCVSGTDASDIYQFRTPPAVNNPGSHFRFLVFGDNQTDAVTARYVAEQAKLKIQELYGYDIQNHINLILHLGDITDNGTVLSSYEDQYFKPFSSLSAYIPSMVTIGNHEADNAYYYQYMKYDELAGALPPIAERYYTFQLSDARFIAVNPNTSYQNSTQQNWFLGALNQAAAESATDFVFVYGHQPFHSEIWPDGNTAWTGTAVLDQMKNFPKSSLYFCGHTHAYEHGVYESTVDSGDFQTIINGGAGGPLDRWGMYTNQTDYPEVFKSLDHYCFNLIDIDVNSKSYTGYTYSFGNPDKPLSCQLMDVFHRKIMQARPTAPTAVSPVGPAPGSIILTASAFNGADSLFSTQFQVTSNPGNYTNPMIDNKRNNINWYGDSGAPGFNPINLGTGSSLLSLDVTTSLTIGQTYGWRVRCRDYNMRWSQWSPQKTFTVYPGYTVSGNLVYDNTAQTALGQVVVKLFKNDTLIYQSITDAGGHFSFPVVIPGQYKVVCSSNRTWGGVNATDALFILKHFTGISILSGLRKQAAETDGNSFINSIDALLCTKRFVGMINTFVVGDWVFDTPEFTILNSNINLNIKGLCTGDVNGSYTP